MMEENNTLEKFEKVLSELFEMGDRLYNLNNSKPVFFTFSIPANQFK